MRSTRLSRLVYGGSFDPVHRGHMAMMQFVLSRGVAPRLDVVPAKVSPFKQDDPPAVPDELRLELLQIAAAVVRRELFGASDKSIRILDFELRSPPPSYTVNTLRWLREQHPDERIGMLIGSDSFHELDAWHAPEEIVAHHTVVVFRRKGDELDELEGHAEKLRKTFAGTACDFRFLNNPLVDCSSSDIRAKLAAGRLEEASPCLPVEVLTALLSRSASTRPGARE